MPDDFENAFIELSQGKVCYDLAGPFDGETVVLIHGLMGNKALWTPLFRQLAEQGYRVLRMDLYGRGKSHKAGIEYHLPLFIFQVMELVDALELRRPYHMVGLSLGSLITAAFTAEMPELIRDLVLISPAGLGLGMSAAMGLVRKPVIGELFARAAGNEAVLKTAAKRIGENNNEDVLHSLEENVGDPEYRAAVLEILRNIDLEHGEEHYRMAARSYKPTLLLWGEKDKLVPFKYAPKALELIPSSWLVSIQKPGICPIWMNLSRF